jgi:hypothetical protein
MLEYWSMANGFDPAFADGLKHGVAIMLLVAGAYNFKLRQYMPWNRK